MAERWPDRFGLCLRAAVLSVCSLCIIFFPQRRLKIDPAGRAVPAGLHAGTTTGLQVWDFGEVPAEENEVSERGFKLTLAAVDCAAPVGLRDRVSVSALSTVCFPFLMLLPGAAAETIVHIFGILVFLTGVGIFIVSATFSGTAMSLLSSVLTGSHFGSGHHCLAHQHSLLSVLVRSYSSIFPA